MKCSELLPGREKEMEFLETFLMDNYKNKTSASLYISGPPGSGKTSSLNIILSQTKVENKFKIIYLNCTSFTRSGSVYGRIIEELNVKNSKTLKKHDLIHEYFSNNKTMTLLVLDEIDELVNQKQTLLYTIFEWPSIPNSKLILIGIANALDLTDRCLPRLHGNLAVKPTLLHFSCYTKQQIVNIITQTLKEASTEKIFPENAVHLLAAKIASFSGDIRKAMDTVQRLIDLAENKSITNDNYQQKILLTDVVSLINNVYGTSQTLNNINKENCSSEDGFPIQHKLIICSLLLLLKKVNCKEVTITKLHETYKNICKKRNLLMLDLAEFISICSLIETKGIFIIKGKIRNRLSKVNLQWNEEEIMVALQDKTLLADILNDKY